MSSDMEMKGVLCLWMNFLSLTTGSVDGTIYSSWSSSEHKYNKQSKSSPMLGESKWFISSRKYLRLIPTLFGIVEVEDVTTLGSDQ